VLPILTILLSASSQANDPLLGQTYEFSAPDPEDEERFGRSGSAGDFNGDGSIDLLISSYYGDGKVPDTGAVYLFENTGSGFTVSQRLAPADLESYFRFGSSSYAGDFNADGIDDVVVSAPNIGGINDISACYLYYGSVTGLSSEERLSEPSGISMLSAGSSMSGGDFDDDGAEDIALRIFDDNDKTYYVYAFYGSTSGLQPTESLIASPVKDSENDGFGEAVSGESDLNGDGYAELLVGAANATGTYDFSQGQAYLYYGSASGIVDSATILESDDELSIDFGATITSADLNGDGYFDAVIGDPAASEAAAYAGGLYIFYGSLTGIGTTPDQLVYPEDIERHDNLGISLDNAGDVDGDGLDDLVAGSDGDGEFSDQGAAFIFYGSASGVTDRIDRLVAKNHDGFNGFSWNHVLGTGDVDKDGMDDVLISFDYHDNNQGAMLLFQANAVDVDGDGFGQRYDCDDKDAAATIYRVMYVDADQDGYGEPGTTGKRQCALPEGFAFNNEDCDDTQSGVSPAADEVCGDGIDNNCDGFGTDADDEDSDGLSGAEERVLGTDPCEEDTDDDGLSDRDEQQRGTNPLAEDTDGDGLFDGDEVEIHGTDPREADTDGDGLSDGAEITEYRTDPLNEDTDGDGILDGDEVANGSDPLTPDAPEDTASPEDTGAPTEPRCGCAAAGSPGSVWLLGLIGIMVRRSRKSASS
jgi:hypothetical protein